jgi:hypothetical protein
VCVDRSSDNDEREKARKVSFNFKVMMSMLLLVMVCGACKTGGTGSAPVGEGKASRATQPFKPSSDSTKDLNDALRKLNSAFPYRLTETTTTSAGGKPVGRETTRIVEFATADRFHVKLAGDEGEDLELITIGEKSYSKQNGKWNEEATGTRPKNVDLEKNLADSIKDVTYVGPETINGIQCFAYNYTIKMDAVTGKGKTWVRASDGLPLQSDSEFKYENFESKSHVVYEYNADVKVEAPM